MSPQFGDGHEKQVWNDFLGKRVLTSLSLAEPRAAERQWRAVDVIVDCFLVTEGGPQRAFASSGNREKALLVLKQVPVLDDGSLEGFTDFQEGAVDKDNQPVIFEASGKSPPSTLCSWPCWGSPPEQPRL